MSSVFLCLPPDTRNDLLLYVTKHVKYMDPRMSRREIELCFATSIVSCIRVVRTGHYRTGDIVFRRGCLWQKSLDIISNNPARYQRSLLYKMADDLKHLDLNGRLRSMRTHIFSKTVHSQYPKNLFIHVRCGDVVVHPWFLTKTESVIASILTHIEHHQIAEVCFVATCCFGVRRRWQQTRQKVFMNRDKLITFFALVYRRIHWKHPLLKFSIVSRKDPDRDLELLVSAKHALVDFGGFGQLVLDVRNLESPPFLL